MSQIDWTKEVEARKEDLFSDLFELLKVNSVRDVEHKTDEYPLGPGPATALEKVLEMGKRDGFRVKNIDNIVGYIEYGDENAEAFGLLGHVDVVPVDHNWVTDPFDPVIKDGKLFARGSSDDKGPSMAAYYAVKIIKELGLPISKKIRFIFGTDEESNWECMARYVQVEEMPKVGFSPDASFPIINGEKAITAEKVTFPVLEGKGDYTLESFKAGMRVNMVPGDATAVVSGENVSTLEADYSKYLSENGVTGSVEFDGNVATFIMIGKGVHAMDPAVGINAATHLANFLNAYNFDGTAANFLKVISEVFHEDYDGTKLGVAHVHSVMGNVSTPANLFEYTPTGKKSVILNIRYPEGTTIEKIEKQMNATLEKYGVKVDIIDDDKKEPHYVPGTDPLVQTLLEVYEEHTGEKAYEESIGGGTYGRILEHGVAYGALFPWRENVMHQPNEYMFVEDIIKSAVIYADAIYRLVK